MAKFSNFLSEWKLAEKVLGNPKQVRGNAIEALAGAPRRLYSIFSLNSCSLDRGISNKVQKNIQCVRSREHETLFARFQSARISFCRSIVSETLPLMHSPRIDSNSNWKTTRAFVEMFSRHSHNSIPIKSPLGQKAMGTSALSKPCAPQGACDRHNRRRFSCLPETFMPTGKRRFGGRKSSILMELILLQDWQRVLIRSKLSPKEVSQPGLINFHGVDWLMFPLHLACALQPPPQVVATLLQYHPIASSLPLELRRKSKRAALSIRKLRIFDTCARSLDLEEGKGLLSRITRPNRNHWISQSNINCDDFSIVTTSTAGKMFSRKMYFYSREGTMESLAQSIEGVNRDDDNATSASWGTWDDRASTLPDSSLCSFLGKRGVALQLSPNGGILPIPIQMSKETASTTDSGPISDCHSKWEVPLAELLAAGESKSLLPIHIACLYRACPMVLKLLLQEYSMGALSSAMGMLPIHLVSAGWSLKPLQTNSSTNSSCSTTENESYNFDASSALRVIVDASSESLFAKSINHGMTPREYVEEVMMDGDDRNRCNDVLLQARRSLQQRHTQGGPSRREHKNHNRYGTYGERPQHLNTTDRNGLIPNTLSDALLFHSA